MSTLMAASGDRAGTQLTNAGILKVAVRVGTPAYMAPELLYGRAEGLTKANDIFRCTVQALAVTACQHTHMQ